MTITTDLIGIWVALVVKPGVKFGVIRGIYLGSSPYDQTIMVPRAIVETHDTRALLHMPLDSLAVYPPWSAT